MPATPNLCTIPCSVNSDLGPLCGTLAEHTPLDMPASELCANAILGQIQQRQKDIEAAEMSARRARLLTDVGWSYLELGMVQTDESLAEASFTKALEYADEAMRDPHAPIDDIVPAALMTIYVPTFKAHKNGLPPSAEEAETLRNDLGTIFDTVRKAPLHGDLSHIAQFLERSEPHEPCFPGHGERKSAMARVLLNTVALRAGKILLPASTRESRWGRQTATNKSCDLIEVDGEPRKRIKVGTGCKADKIRDWGERPIDQKVTFINFAGVVNLACIAMRNCDERGYGQLVAHTKGRPGLTELGFMLRAEMGAGAWAKKGFDNASRTFVETVTRILFDHMEA